MLPIKQISIIGMVLAVVSAITAAILPNNGEQPKKYLPGVLQASTFGNLQIQQTCVTGIAGPPCIMTISSNTTEGEGGDTSGTSTNGLTGESSTRVNTTA